MDSQTREANEIVAALLDDLKARHGFTSNYALARYLGVHEIYISRWYAGEYGRTAMRTLTPHLVDFGRRAPALSAA
jgi:hypothetical protein